MVKINWDDALDVLNKRMGVGVIARDADGAVVATLCAVVPHISDPAVAECVALWKAITLSIDLDLPRLHLEVDSQEIVQALLQEGPCLSLYENLIQESQICLNGLQEWHISNTRREANEVAHRLAKAVLNKSLNFVWRDSHPDFITSIVLAEQGSSF